MKSYYRIMLGRKSVHAQEYFAGGFIGAGLACGAFDFVLSVSGEL